MTPKTLITRREAIRIGGLTLLLAPWALAAEGEGFEFIAITDTHYINDECNPWHSQVIKGIREDAPHAAFVVHSGDISDKGGQEALTAIRDLYAKAELTLHTAPGNHDWISDADPSGYDAVFPAKRNYTFTHGGWQFLALDTTDGTHFTNTAISKATFAWLDEELKKLDPKVPTFVYTHFPLGEGIKMRPKNAGELIERLAKLNVKWVHSGHTHSEEVHQIGDTSLSTSRCCARLRNNFDGSPLKGWYVYRASADGTLSRRWVTRPA